VKLTIFHFRLGCVLDVACASWTLSALLQQGGLAFSDFPMPSTFRELAARLLLCDTPAHIDRDYSTCSPCHTFLSQMHMWHGGAFQWRAVVGRPDIAGQHGPFSVQPASLICILMWSVQSLVAASWAPVVHMQPQKNDAHLGLCRLFWE
jgi:hypothetical protein